MNKKRLLCMLSLSALTLCSCGGKSYQPEDYMLSLPWKDDFKILQLSDIHLANKDEQDLHLKFLDHTIKAEQDLDLIVLCGDLFTFADKDTAKTLFNFMDEYEIPWTVTFGNHDEQTYYSIDWMTGLLNKMSTSGKNHCYFKDIQDDKVFGNSNFVINLMENNKVHTQIGILDSNRYNFGEYLGYDYIKQSQIDWFSSVADKTKSMTSDGNYATSLWFFHIPVPEFKYAWDSWEASGHKNTEDVRYLGGDAGEGNSVPDINSGFFDVAKEKGVKGMFCAHDHLNDWAIEYKGVTLSYGVTSTDRIYRDVKMMGGTTITIHDDNTFDIARSFHTYEEVM